MATQYYWREGDTVQGPVSFQELAWMVRDLRINEDDLVRPSYSKEWQLADSVVGLFYMAQRVPKPRPEPEPEPEPVPELIQPDSDGMLIDELDDMLALADELSHEPLVPMSSSAAAGMDKLPGVSLMDLVGGATQPAPKVPLTLAIIRRTQSWLLRNRLISITAALLVIIGGSWSAYAVGRSADVQRYMELKQVLKNLDETRNSPQADFSQVRAEMERIVREYPEPLIREGASRQNPLKQKLLFVAQELLPGMLKTDLKKRTLSEKYMNSRLREVGRQLGCEQ